MFYLVSFTAAFVYNIFGRFVSLSAWQLTVLTPTSQTVDSGCNLTCWETDTWPSTCDRHVSCADRQTDDTTSADPRVPDPLTDSGGDQTRCGPGPSSFHV